MVEQSHMSALENSPALQGFYGWTDTLKGVYYGPGSVVTALPKLLNTLGVKKALVVTGKSLQSKVFNPSYQPADATGLVDHDFRRPI
jgi:hypothetical protein